jgi:hypothetical protein
MSKRAVGLATLVLACLALVPAAAQAQYPYDWHAATPPSWFTESTDSSCQTREQYVETIDVPPGQQWALIWASSTDSFRCFKPLPFSPELGPGIGIYCTGTVQHYHQAGFPDSYTAVWRCKVGTDNSANCLRESQYEERPLGTPNEAYNRDSGWYDPDTFAPYDCRPSGLGDDGGSGSAACDWAKEKVEKAKQKLQQADSPESKQRAKKKLKKAKKKKQEACG